MIFNIIKTNDAPATIGPYVQATYIDNMIFVSGQIPICPKNNIIPYGIINQTNQSLSNIKAILASANVKLTNIIKTTVFMKNLDDLDIFNKTYETFFIKNNASLPSRSCIEVNRLPKNALVEIEAIAIKKVNIIK